jgi:hypothetical protein
VTQLELDEWRDVPADLEWPVIPPGYQYMTISPMTVSYDLVHFVNVKGDPDTWHDQWLNAVEAVVADG